MKTSIKLQMIQFFIFLLILENTYAMSEGKVVKKHYTIIYKSVDKKFYINEKVSYQFEEINIENNQNYLDLLKERNNEPIVSKDIKKLNNEKEFSKISSENYDNLKGDNNLYKYYLYTHSGKRTNTNKTSDLKSNIEIKDSLVNYKNSFLELDTDQNLKDSIFDFIENEENSQLKVNEDNLEAKNDVNFKTMEQIKDTEDSASSNKAKRNADFFEQPETEYLVKQYFGLEYTNLLVQGKHIKKVKLDEENNYRTAVIKFPISDLLKMSWSNQVSQGKSENKKLTIEEPKPESDFGNSGINKQTNYSKSTNEYINKDIENRAKEATAGTNLNLKNKSRIKQSLGSPNNSTLIDGSFNNPITDEQMYKLNFHRKLVHVNYQYVINKEIKSLDYDLMNLIRDLKLGLLTKEKYPFELSLDIKFLFGNNYMSNLKEKAKKLSVIEKLKYYDQNLTTTFANDSSKQIDTFTNTTISNSTIIKEINSIKSLSVSDSTENSLASAAMKANSVLQKQNKTNTLSEKEKNKLILNEKVLLLNKTVKNEKNEQIITPTNPLLKQQLQNTPSIPSKSFTAKKSFSELLIYHSSKKISLCFQDFMGNIIEIDSKTPRKTSDTPFTLELSFSGIRINPALYNELYILSQPQKMVHSKLENEVLQKHYYTYLLLILLYMFIIFGISLLIMNGRPLDKKDKKPELDVVFLNSE